VSDMWGGYGTGFDQNTMAQLLPLILGSMSDQKSAFGVQQSGLNNMQDIIKLLFDPQYAMMTGTYDPMLSVDQQGMQQGLSLPTPLLDGAARSGDPTIAMVASMVKSGEIADSAVAYKTLFDKATDPSSALYGYTPEQIKSTVDDWFGELADQQITLARTQYDASSGGSGGSSKPKDVWAAAGIPNPTEQYYGSYDPTTGMLDTNAPLSADVSARVKKTRDGLSAAQQAYRDFLLKNPDYRSPSVRSESQRDYPKLQQATKDAMGDPANELSGQEALDYSKLLVDNYSTKVNALGFDPKLIDSAMLDGKLTRQEVADLWPNADNQGDHIKRVSTSSLDGFDRLMSGRRTGSKTAAEWSGRGAIEAKRNSGSQAQSGLGDSVWRSMRQAQDANDYTNGSAVGEALAMQMLGRTPAQDNIQRRLAMFRAAGLL